MGLLFVGGQSWGETRGEGDGGGGGDVVVVVMVRSR